MNDEMNQFEQRLRHQPIKKIPTEWRAEILSTARDAQAIRPSSPAVYHSWFSTLNFRLSTLLWPHPKAWAGLAAVWICILTLNFSTHDVAPVTAKKSAPPSPEMMAELRQQQKMFAELAGSTEARMADRRPVFAPKPRSEFTEISAI